MQEVGLSEGENNGTGSGYSARVNPMRDRIEVALLGALSGATATVVMSVVLEAGRRLGSYRRLSPTLIVRTVLRGDPAQRAPAEGVLAVLSHLGYGTMMGAAFGGVAGARRASTAAGIGFGLLVWLASYEGWVPALGAVPPAHRDRSGRPLSLALGHVVYGAVLAVGLRRLRRMS